MSDLEGPGFGSRHCNIEIDAKKRMFLLLLSATCLVANGNPPPSSPCLSEELLPEPSPLPNLKPRPDRRPRKWSQIECAVFYNCYEKVLSDKDKEDKNHQHEGD